MPSTPDQFCNELNEYTNLTLPCQKQEAEEKEALQQATAQAGSCVQAQDEFTSPKNTPSNHLPAYGRYSPVNAMQHGHALYCRRQTCLSPDGQQQAYPITSSARAHHIQATKPAIHKGQTHQYSQPGHQQHQWLEYTRAALAPTETQEHGSPAALAAQAHPPWIYTQTPTYHDEHDPQARPYDSHFNSRHQTVVSADMPTSSLNLPPFSDPQLAPYFSPNPHGSDPNQHQNTSGHRCQSAITRVHFPALTVTPVPDGPRIHHPSLTYAIERDNTLPRGSRIHHPSFAFVPEFHGDGNASNGPAATDAIQPQSAQASRSPSTSSHAAVGPLELAYTATPQDIDVFESGQSCTRVISQSLSPKTVPAQHHWSLKQRLSPSPGDRREVRPLNQIKFAPVRKWSPTRLRELKRKLRPRNLPKAIDYTEFDVVQDVPIAELVNQWTEVIADSGSGHAGDDEHEHSCEEIGGDRKWTVNMSVGSREHTATVPLEGQSSMKRRIPFNLTVQDQHGQVLWDMSWTWYGD